MISISKPERKRSLGKPKGGYKYNIRRDPKEVGSEGVDGIKEAVAADH
jgi:hypothetical protein